MNRPVRHPGSLLVVVIAQALAGCASSDYHTSIPFKYPSMGVGEGATSDVIAVEPGKEKLAIADAILAAFQKMGHGVVDPDVPVGELLPQKTPIVTDFVTLDDQAIKAHNAEKRSLSLPLDAYYSLRYTVEYAVVGKEFRLKIRSDLRRKGAAGRWHEYPGTYNAPAFAAAVTDKIRNALSGPQP